MKVTNGSMVKVHYKGTLSDGREFDNSHTRGQTLDFKVGAGQMIKGFNDAVIGMTKGQTKSFTILAEDAYGEYNPEAFTTAPKTAFPPNFNFEVGAEVQGQTPSGQPFLAKITALENDEVTLDVNHPLAGQDLTFEVEVVEVEETN
tara:strand:+ start:22 stop:459 length:438 start_codon:yes stop_codon:yes gene_type:complete